MKFTDIKRCNVCLIFRKINYFHKAGSGRRNHCALCATVKMRNYRQKGSTVAGLSDMTVKQLETMKHEIHIELGRVYRHYKKEINEN